jgi:hypothetical protein
MGDSSATVVRYPQAGQSHYLGKQLNTHSSSPASGSGASGLALKLQ